MTATVLELRPGTATRPAAAAPDELLAELRHAHEIIRNAHQIMTLRQKFEWMRRNDCAGVSGFGSTRAHERAAVIQRAEARS